MDKYQNIMQTKEYQLVRTIEGALNSFSFDEKVFAASIPAMHPTLQQSFYRLLRESLRKMADDSRHYDDRNMASHNEAKAIMDYLKGKEHPIPMR